MKLPYKNNGFTLIEVLVAISLLAILLLALYLTFFSVLQACTRIDSELKGLREVSRFLDIFSREVHSAFYTEANAKTILKGEQLENSSKSLSSLTMTSFTYPMLKEDQVSSDLRTIKYYIETNQDGSLTLCKEIWNPYLEESRKNEIKVEVIDDVVHFEVSYYNGRDWSKLWDSSLEKKLPQAVKAVIRIKVEGDIKEFTTITRTMIR